MTEFEYAARLNSFLVNKKQYWSGRNDEVTALDLVARAATVRGLNAVDLNYPDHVEGLSEAAITDKLQECGIRLNGYAMRYYSDPGFKIGAFTNPDPSVRRAAIDLTKRGLDYSQGQAGR